MDLTENTNDNNPEENWVQQVRQKLLREGVIPLVGTIDDRFLENFLVPLEWLIDTPDNNIQHISLIINSGGGDASWLGRAMRAIASSKKPVIAYIDQACSAALMIAAACHVRFCYPTSIMMHHRCSTEVVGSGKELQLQSYMVDAIDDACDRLLIQRTKITQKLIDEHRDNNWWITPDRALELGVVHEILDFDYTIDEVSFPTDKGKEKSVRQSTKKRRKSK